MTSYQQRTGQPFLEAPQSVFTEELLEITGKLKAALASGDWLLAAAYAAQLADWTKIGKKRFQ